MDPVCRLTGKCLLAINLADVFGMAATLRLHSHKVNPVYLYDIIASSLGSSLMV